MYFGLLSIGLLNIQSMLQDQLLDDEQVPGPREADDIINNTYEHTHMCA